MTDYRISEAAELLGVSDDTVRRWVESGALEARTDHAGRSVVGGVELAALAVERARTPEDPRRRHQLGAQPADRPGHRGSSPTP